MRLVLRNYLYSLKEDRELDKICVEMLEDMGMSVHASAQKGTRQYGVDVLAHGKMPGCTEDKVYALIIKCKDIGRGEFYKDETGVEVSIKECLNVYAQNLLPDECRGLPLVICVVCGGEIKFEIRGDLSALTEREFAWYRQKGLMVYCEEWNGDKLASLLDRSLQNSNLLVSGDKRLFFRALALAQEPHESFRAFRVFVNQILDFNRVETKNLRLKALREINLSLAMLIRECGEDDVRNYEAAWLSAEYVYLKEWEYLQRCKVEKCYDRKFDSAIDDAARMYCRVAESYLDRISIFVKERYGFALAVDGNDELDVILKFYDVLGKVSTFGLYLIVSNGEFCHEDDEMPSEKRSLDVRKKTLSVLMYMLAQNSVAATPILDSQALAVASAIQYLLLEGVTSFVEQWLEILVGGIFALFKQGYAFPVNDMAYKDLLEHMHAPNEDRKLEEILRSSELLPVLAMAALKVGRKDIYAKIRELAMKLPRAINYQMWFLNEDSEVEFYSGDQLCGSQLCSLNIEDGDGLFSIIEAEAKASPINLSCMNTPHSGLLYIGCRHYGFPLPGNVWA